MKLVREFNANEEVIGIAQSLDSALKAKNFDPDGLNPQRNELYKECFEQLISSLQNCPDLANLLSRIKDELTMTSDSYKKLYESSVTFGIRKALTARHENENLMSKNKSLSNENAYLKEQNEYLLRKISVLEQKTSDRKGERKVAKYKKEIKRMKDRTEAIKQHVEECLVQGHNEVCNAIQQNTNTHR